METDAGIWTVDGSENEMGRTVAMIGIASQSVIGAGIDGEIENFRLVQVDETAMIANIVMY